MKSCPTFCSSDHPASGSAGGVDGGGGVGVGDGPGATVGAPDGGGDGAGAGRVRYQATAATAARALMMPMVIQTVRAWRVMGTSAHKRTDCARLWLESHV